MPKRSLFDMLTSLLKKNLFKKNKALAILLLLLLLLPPLPFIIEFFNLRLDNSFISFIQNPWRLLTAHLIHGSWLHLLLNIANLILLRLVFIHWISDKSFFIFLVFSALFISIGLWAISDLSFYIGFSGIFHGLLIYLLLIYWKQNQLIYSIGIGLVLTKVAHEQVFGASSSLANLIGMNIAIDAHLLGVLSGFIFLLAQKLFVQKNTLTN
jgi:rhomboid family GlyGly-CTERM serine protease